MYDQEFDQTLCCTNFLRSSSIFIHYQFLNETLINNVILKGHKKEKKTKRFCLLSQTLSLTSQHYFLFFPFLIRMQK